MNVQNKVQLSGRFTMEAVRLDGSKRKLAEFDNLILDQGLNQIGTTGFLAACMVGTSSAAASAGQTALVAQLASTTQIVSTLDNADIPNGYAYIRRTFRFGIGSAAGNLSEVGVGPSSPTCFSRARIVDGNGAPTTITVLADEYLDVTYEFRMYWPAADATGNLTINSVNYTWTARAARVGSWSARLLGLINSGAGNTSIVGILASYGAGSLGPTTGEPTGTMGGGPDTVTASPYTAGSYQRIFQATWGLGYTSQIQSLLLNVGPGSYQVRFDPIIPKTGANILTMSLATSWARRSI